MLRVLWELECLVTVCLVTPLTLRREWSQPVCVSFSFIVERFNPIRETVDGRNNLGTKFYVSEVYTAQQSNCLQ